MIRLDERLEAIAQLVHAAVAGAPHPTAADIGCDHGYLTAGLLERMPQLTMLASDVSAPSLEKARRLMDACGLTGRVRLDVADGLSAVDTPVDAIVIAGMGAETILRIVAEGRDRIGGAALIVQANVDLPVLRRGLASLGFAVEQERYARAAGRHYVTLCARSGEASIPDDREALLGRAADGGPEAASYLAWQRGVRVRELEQLAGLETDRAASRRAHCGRELTWIAEAIGMNGCTVADIERLVGGIAPYGLAEEWDNVGLLLGEADAPVTSVLVALDLTDGALAQAKALGAQVIVTHHPIMMAARRRVTDADREGRLMLALARAGIAHIAAHTNLDAAPGGVNDTLMALMGAKNVRGEGCVRVGDLPQGTTLGALARRAERVLHGPVRVYGAADTVVSTLGCCSGAGSGEIGLAAGADCFITGEVKHHHALDALAAGVCVLEAGHFETENPVCEVLRNGLQNACDALKYNVTVFCSKDNPFGR
ncbi:MAG: Nif3-like dinuclear metal center hexameric protein [Candidatus Ventricola sp.]